MMKRLSIGLFISCLLSTSIVGGASLTAGRLFTTQQQRVLIEQEQSSFVLNQHKHRLNLDASPEGNHRRLFFEALMLTDTGYAIGLNGRFIEAETHLEGIAMNRSQIATGVLILQTAKGVRRLGVGQIYWIEQDKVTESYEQP